MLNTCNVKRLTKFISVEHIRRSGATALVSAFPKPNKPKDDADNYRPITLTSCVGKLIEKIINIRFVRYLESNNILSPAKLDFAKCVPQ